MQPPRKLPFILLALAVVVVAGTLISASVMQRDSDDTPSMATTNNGTSSSAPAGSEGEGSNELSTVQTGTPAAVSGAGNNLGLGFNNAEQVVENGDGSMMVWLSGDAVVVAERSKDGTVTSTKTVATGILQLPSIAKSGDAVAVGWTSGRGTSTTVNAVVSTNGGKTFGGAVSLGAGTGLSLSADNGVVVAVWHKESTDGTAQILFSRYTGSWSAATRVDTSTAAPLWSAVDVQGGNVFVTWRDNRTGDYSIWLRRSTDGGATWQAEQHIVTATSGDPDVCATSDGQVWVAHHGRGNISLLHSTDNGATFGTDQSIGKGFFAHLSCTEKGTAVAWEYTAGGGAKSANKQAGWALYNKQAEKVDDGVLGNAPDAAATAFLTSDSKSLEILWVQVAGDAPLVGQLMHTLIPISL